MRFTFKVTQEDLDSGTIMHGAKCPVALALKRQGFTDICVTQVDVSCTKGKTQYIGNTSKRLREFIQRVDDSDAVIGLSELKPTQFGLVLSKIREG